MGIMDKLIIKNNISDYLSVSQYINWKEAAILRQAEFFQKQTKDEISLIKNIYEFVRDNIKHSWDAQDRRCTKSATEVLEQGVGICWAKANLLAALLRACDIPAGICYQRLTLGDNPESGFCIHALNAVYIKSLHKWIRVDARGNKEGVAAAFCLEREQLAFPVRNSMGEVDYPFVYANPSAVLMDVLEQNTDVLYMYQHELPDTLFRYKKAAIEDLDQLVQTRMIVLRAANELAESVDMTQVEKETKAYYKRALSTAEHTAYLVYDDQEFIGAGSVSFFQVMPTYHNPSGRKAYIMNMYTAPAYRRLGIAYRTLELLMQDIKTQGISQITLEATKAGRKLYEKFGFVPMKNEMEYAGIFTSPQL